MFDTDNIKVVDVPISFLHKGKTYTLIFLQQPVVFRGVGNSCPGPSFQMWQLYVEYSRLQSIQPAVPAFDYMIMFSLLPMVSYHPGFLCNSRICRRHCPRIAIGPQILPWIKTKAGSMSEGAYHLPLYLCAVCLCAVLYYYQIMLCRNTHDGGHICGVTIQMYRYDSFCPWCDCLFNQGNINSVVFVFNINKYWFRSNRRNRLGCRYPGNSRNNYLVVFSNSKRLQ